MNYAKFYQLLNGIPTSDREELKISIVMQFTNNRTSSLREMTLKEYNAACKSMKDLFPQSWEKTAIREELRRQRSATLKLMQLWGVDTTDWNVIDHFCQNTRIAKKRFRDITSKEHEALQKKLRAMLDKKEKE